MNNEPAERSDSSSSPQSPLEQIRATAPARPASGRLHPKRSRFTKSILHLTRRGHLYAGLLLIPWVMLYGVTGFLFNHSTFWPDRPVIHIRQSHTQGTPVASLPRSVDIAEEIVAAINANGNTQYSLVNPGSVSFTRGAFSASLKGQEGKQYAVQLFPDGTGAIRTSPAGAPSVRSTAAAAANASNQAEGRRSTGNDRAAAADQGNERGKSASPNTRGESRSGGRDSSNRAPFAVASGMDLKKSPLADIESGLPEVLRRLELDQTEISNIRASTVKFKMQGEGKIWDVLYDPNSGSVTAEDTTTSPAMSFRMFLLRLHMVHGYVPGSASMRWLWVIMSDATALIMIYWGISGIVMWWQIKRTRLLGSICLGISLLAATYIGIGMHEIITSAVSP